jgi:hypothetical protein
MRLTQSRRCTLLDAMALIAATAIGFGLARAYSLEVLSAYFASSAFATSMAVAAAWRLLTVSGRWRSEPAWLGRLGRGLGAYWIGIIPFSCWWDYHMLY